VLERREHRQGTGVVQSGILHARVSPVYDSLKPPAKLSRKRLKWIDIHRVYCLRRIVIVAAIMVLLLRLFVFVIHSLFVRLQRSRKGKQNLTITKPNETQSRSCHMTKNFCLSADTLDLSPEMNSTSKITPVCILISFFTHFQPKVKFR